MGVPRTTHQWLRNLYNYLDGKSLSPTGLAVTQLGSATGLLGLYGQTGAKQVSTGTAGITAWTGAGASVGLLWFNGGSGAFYTVGDVVVALKNLGVLKP